MKRVNWVVFAGAIVFLVGAFLIYRGIIHEPSLDNIRQRGTLRAGYAIEPPYAYLLPGGEVTGEFPEITKYVASALEIERIEWRQVEFSELIPELVDGRIDVIAAGMFITPERSRLVNFSEPVVHVRQGLITVKGNPRNIHSYQEAINDSGIKIAALSGSVEEGLLRRIGLADSQLVIVPDALTGRVAVEAGRADGLALSSPTIRWLAQQGEIGRLEMVQTFSQPSLPEMDRLGYAAFAFRKEDLLLRDAWNEVLKPFVGSTAHVHILARFGFTAAELPDVVSARELSQP